MDAGAKMSGAGAKVSGASPQVHDQVTPIEQDSAQISSKCQVLPRCHPKTRCPGVRCRYPDATI